MRSLGLLFILFALSAGIACGASAPHGVYTAGLQRWLHIGDTHWPTKAKSSAYAVGYRYRAENWHVGLNFSYEYAKRKDSALEVIRVNPKTPGFAVHGGYRFASGIGLRGTAFVGFSELTFSSRFKTLLQEHVGRDTIHNTQAGFGIEADKAYIWRGLIVTPHIGLDYSYSPEERYVVDNIPGLPVAFRAYQMAEKRHFLEIPLGVRLEKTFSRAGWNLTPSLDLTFINVFKRDNELNAAPGYASFDGERWRIYGVRSGAAAGRFTGALAVDRSGNFSVKAEYAYERRLHYNDHRLTAKLALAF